MWEDTKIETFLRKALKSKFGSKADFYIALYVDAKTYLCNNIYSQIPAKEGDLTDHTEKHVEDVLNKVGDLISISESKKTAPSFNEIEILLLCESVLFHDVGNIHGRYNHNKNVSDIYNSVRANKLDDCRQERTLLLRMVQAHCGKSNRGDNDTLLDVEISNHLFNSPIRLRELAAILRLADELAEGPQRTSQYMLENNMVSKNSAIFHKYSSITTIHIDKGNERIVLSYNIDYPIKDKNITFKSLLRFVYKRILKLDAERRYCKYYAPSLVDFKRTEASIVFTIKGNLSNYDMPKINLEDKYSLTEENVDSLIKMIPSLDIEQVEKNIKDLSKRKK